MSDDPILLDDLVLRRPVASPPPDVLVLRDANGQPWSITVRPDGQLQTAKYPDGEPMTPSDYASKVANSVLKDGLRMAIKSALDDAVAN